MSIVNQLPMQDDDLGIELAKIILTAKGPKWRYEKEVRIIRHNPGALKIEKNFIRQICFGLNSSRDDIELIKEITSHYNPKVQLCRVIRSDSDFGIDVRKLNKKDA